MLLVARPILYLYCNRTRTSRIQRQIETERKAKEIVSKEGAERRRKGMEEGN
jgi:hypothetical protein